MALMRDLSMWVFAAIRGVAQVANAAPAARSSRLVMIMIVVDRMDWTNATGRKIVLQEGDITQIAVDAMANAANSALAGGGGVDAAIHRAGRRAIMREKVKAKRLIGVVPQRPNLDFALPAPRRSAA